MAVYLQRIVSVDILIVFSFCLYHIAHCFWSTDTQSFLLLKLYKQFYTLYTVSHSIVNHFILYTKLRQVFRRKD